MLHVVSGGGGSAAAPTPMCRPRNISPSGTLASGGRFRFPWAPLHQIGTSFSVVDDGGFGYPALQAAEAGTYAVLWMIQTQLAAAGLVAVNAFDQNGNQTEVGEFDYWPQTTASIVQLAGAEIWIVSAPPGDFTLELHNQTTDDMILPGISGVQMHIYKISSDSLPF